MSATVFLKQIRWYAETLYFGSYGMVRRQYDSELSDIQRSSKKNPPFQVPFL